MADLGSFKVVVEKLKDQRERVVIVLLLVVLGWLSLNTWGMLQRQRSDEEDVRREILEELGYRRPGDEEVGDLGIDPNKIADRLLNPPPQGGIVRPLIEVDPLRPREDINEIRREIGMLLEQAMMLMEQGKYADAILVFDEILEIDPAGVKFEYREGTPRDLRAEAAREQTRGRMIRAKTEADEGYESGKQQLEAGNKTKARDVLLEARRDYQQILDWDPDRQILDESVYAAIDAQIEELTEITNKLIQDTLSQEIASKRQKVEEELAAYRQNPEDINALASAREALIESLGYVESVDPERVIIAASVVEEIEAKLQEVEGLIVDLVPALVTGAQEAIVAFEGTQDPGDRILKGQAALQAVKLLSRMRTDPKDQQIYEQIERDLEELRRYVAVNRGEAILAEANSHFEKAMDAVRRTDMTEAASEKEAALAVLAELSTLDEEDIRELLTRADNLRREIEMQIRSLPLVTGVEVAEIDPGGKWVRLFSDREGWSERRHTLGIRDTKTNIRVTQIVPTPDDGEPYVVVSRPGFMETKLAREGQ